MKIIDSNFNNHHTVLIIDRSIIENLNNYLKKYSTNKKFIIITQKNIYKIFESSFKKIESNCNFKIIFINNDESAKSLNSYNNTIKKLIEFNCDRKTTLIAFGGGVVGDLAGFVGSTYMRGIEFIQIPTTMLSMIDSSIGGKNGVNLSNGKNLIGTFYQPKLILIDPTLIKTLPKKEIVSALGEMIKYSVISNVEFLKYINKNIYKIINRQDIDIIESAIERCVKIKLSIVEEDEKDENIRQILNYGHTLAHALENNLGYGKISHGEAVAYGILTASYLSMKIQKLSLKEYQIIYDSIKKLSLSIITNVNIDKLIKVMYNDKKNSNKNIYFVLIEKIGVPKINNIIDENEIIEAIKQNEYISC